MREEHVPALARGTGCGPGAPQPRPPLLAQLTQRLELQGNVLKEIPPAAFRDLPFLTHLDLRYCQVELVAEGAFRGLGRLLLLNLASNRLSALPQEALDQYFPEDAERRRRREQERKKNPDAFQKLGFSIILVEKILEV